jgi:hypothetical protein
MRRIASVALVVLASCSSGSSSPGGGGSSTTDTTLSVGPIPVDASQETTVCIVVPFGNTEDVVVNSVDATLQAGSHHLIAYLTSASEQTTPFPCSPFTGVAFGSDAPLLFANEERVRWAFPSGVGQDIPAGSMVKIEAHYINTTAKPIQGSGQVVFHTTPKASSGQYQPANFTFWGTLHINVPPNASASTPVLFQSGVAGTHMLSISTHQHRLGTGIQVWESSKQGQMGTRIANDLNWANPAWTTLSPTYDFDGTNGLSFQCSWTNTTSQTVTFGESALDEMCFVGGYVYPATHIDVCIDGRCKDR